MASLRRGTRIAALVLAAGSLGACATVPPPPPGPPPPPPINTTVYAYPQHGQTAAQLDRDQYECYLWAKKQTGFDPSSPNLPVEARVRVVQGPPPGTGTAVGAVTGAVLGAAISNPWHRGFGALAGAIIGGAIGSSADAARAERNQAAANYSDAQLAKIEQQASNYRRALAACLQGRGYSVH
ncbi:MAG: glycine zipper 2TM domain-containing protein [Steroidobacteraceae bacterium]